MNIFTLVDNTESMNAEEKKWWYGIIPTLKTEQLASLEAILQKEQDALAKLEEDFITNANICVSL